MTPYQFALALCFLPLAAGAAEDPIAIDQEPRHRLVFQNEYVRFFDVELEPGYESRYHWHRSDGVFVNIASAPTIAQDFGKEPVRRGERHATGGFQVAPAIRAGHARQHRDVRLPRRRHPPQVVPDISPR